MPTKSLPVTEKGRATKERIIGAATELMFEFGVRGTSLDDVCESAGTGKSQIYHYFPDKASLVQAVIRLQTERVVGAQESTLTCLDTWDAWQQWRDLMVEYQREIGCVGGCPLGSLANELSDNDEAARAELGDSFSQWKAAFRTGLASMQRKGKLLANADVDAIAVATLASLQGGLLLCKLAKDTQPLECALDAAIVFVRSYAA